MLEKLEALDRQVWEAHPRMLEDLTHVVGGTGVGLLVYSAVARWARPIAFILLGLSSFLHLYAFIAAQPKLRIGMEAKMQAAEERLRRVA